jgi:hypothetical protein
LRRVVKLLLEAGISIFQLALLKPLLLEPNLLQSVSFIHRSSLSSCRQAAQQPSCGGLLLRTLQPSQLIEPLRLKGLCCPKLTSLQRCRLIRCLCLQTSCLICPRCLKGAVQVCLSQPSGCGEALLAQLRRQVTNIAGGLRCGNTLKDTLPRATKSTSLRCSSPNVSKTAAKGALRISDGPIFDILDVWVHILRQVCPRQSSSSHILRGNIAVA